MVPSGMLRRVALVRTASVVPSSPILVTLMKEALSSSETSGLTRATWRNIPEDTILHSHCCENLKSYNNHFIKWYPPLNVCRWHTEPSSKHFQQNSQTFPTSETGLTNHGFRTGSFRHVFKTSKNVYTYELMPRSLVSNISTFWTNLLPPSSGCTHCPSWRLRQWILLKCWWCDHISGMWTPDVTCKQAVSLGSSVAQRMPCFTQNNIPFHA
jgi:hypothetical protein